MSWQERKIEIGSALEILTDQQRRVGKRGGRTHQETYWHRVAKITALRSGPCRNCQGLKIEVYKGGHSPDASLECLYKQFPLSIHLPYVTRPGEVPKCPSQVLFEQKEESSTT